MPVHCPSWRRAAQTRAAAPRRRRPRPRRPPARQPRPPALRRRPLPAAPPPRRPAVPRRRRPAVPRPRRPAVPPTSMSQVGGSVTFGSNYSDAVPKKAVQAVMDAFTKASGTKVTVNTVDHNSFQENITNYLQGSPDQVFTWFAGNRMQFFAAQGLVAPIDDVWTRPDRPVFRGLSEGVDRRRRQEVLRPLLQLPVGDLLPQERVRRQGLHRPDDRGTSSRPSARR